VHHHGGLDDHDVLHERLDRHLVQCGVLHFAHLAGLVLHAQSGAGRVVGRVRQGAGEGGGARGLLEVAASAADGEGDRHLH